MKIVKSLEKSGLLRKVVRETITVNVLRNMLTRQGVIRAGERSNRADQNF